MATPETLSCFLVRQIGKDQVEAGVETRPLRELPSGDVLVRVRRSSLNYKDAMAAAGHAGIVRKFPHVPGIDAAGVVISSSSPRFHPGQEVFSTGHELGVERWGGWATHLQLPAAWVLPLPAGLSIDEVMGLGTAGFTAAQCVQALLQHGVSTEAGEILVTGATGGVASLSIMILAQLGFRVAAMTGKLDRGSWLNRLGAARLIERVEFLKAPSRPLLSAQFAAAIDTVGGETLSTLLRTIQHRGCVACCGVAGGADLTTTVYPFILRGVTLCGIDSAWCPDALRPDLWNRLAGPWKPALLSEIVRHVPLQEAGMAASDMLAGRSVGRTIIDLPE